MNDYKRIVSYLYYYGNREKKNNVGYVRMERKSGICKVTIHMRSINSNDKKLGFDKQALYSYSLKFDFKTDAGILNYLNGKRFTFNEVWFADKLFGDRYKNLLL